MTLFAVLGLMVLFTMTEGIIPHKAADVTGKRPPPLPERPLPSESPEPEPSGKSLLVKVGLASTYGPGYDGYLALPEGRGIKVRVCGAGGCIVRVSNDAGPSLAMQRKGRIIDLNVSDFEKVCGCSWSRGLVKVSVEYL